MDSLYSSYSTDDSLQKYNHLQGKYVMRFPFTTTAMKWGFTLGSFIAIHTYIKKRRIQEAAISFVTGTFLSGMTIWGFFMFKYSFYSFTLRKFEQEQFGQMEQSQLLKQYLKEQVIKQEVRDDDQMVEKVQKIQSNIYKKHSKLDNLLKEEYIDKLEKEMFQS